MATSVYTRTFWSGADGSAWPAAEWVGSGSTGHVEDIFSSGIRGQTGNVGGFADYTHYDLVATGTTAGTDFGVVGRCHWPNPLTDQTWMIFLRASNDWTNFTTPDTWVACKQDYLGACAIQHRLSSGTVVTDTSAAAGTIPMTGGTSNWWRFEVQGNTLQAKWWQNTGSEPAGWTLGPVTMASSIVPGPGRVKFNLLGASAAGITAMARIVQIDVYDLSASTPTTPPAFVAAPARLHRDRLRRRR